MIRLALFGSGVGSSLSPAIYTGFARGRGLRLEYRVYEAGPGGLAPALEAAGDLHGFNVTKPLKREALRLAARLDQHARAIGAVNTMVAGEEGWEGFNTDWRGFLDSLRLYTASPPDKALVIGAGGAGRAAAYALATWGAGRVLIASRTGATARKAAEDLGGLGAEVEAVSPGGLEAAASEAEVVVNATPLGWDGVSTPITRGFREGCIAVDMVYRPLTTPFLRLAAASGCTPVDGLWMLVLQARENIAIWLGAEADPMELRMHALEALSRG